MEQVTDVTFPIELNARNILLRLKHESNLGSDDNFLDLVAILTLIYFPDKVPQGMLDERVEKNPFSADFQSDYASAFDNALFHRQIYLVEMEEEFAREKNLSIKLLDMAILNCYTPNSVAFVLEKYN